MTTISAATVDIWPQPEPPGDTTRAVLFKEHGGPEVLYVGSVPTPTPGPADVLIRVAAVSVGRTLDLLARSGRGPYRDFPLPHVLGAEHAGVVVAVGSDVTQHKIGDHVAVFPIISYDDPVVRPRYPELSPASGMLGITLPGAYKDHIAVPASNAFPVPAGMSPADAVAVALAGVVGLTQLERAGYERGQRVVVQGASSALGSTTALLAKHLGARVVVTSRDTSKRERLAALGFETVLDSGSKTLADELRGVFDGEGADIVIDNLGDRDLWEQGMAALAPGGAIVSSGAFLSPRVDIDLRRLYRWGHRVIGVLTGHKEAAPRLWGEVEAGFRSVVDRTFPLEDAGTAHAYMEAGNGVGRVALLNYVPS